ncbi:hypothetical protein [Leucobacter luti]|uniref:hypothetical protein n=1 Tax=Leucobacter luti TaxID=340320 RepID=UPI001C68EC45|nr:hypothetical protein [Leucobacter luti]QYM75949.1 hypothetical protein K1X41_00150 [Leucobacter luti]
MNDVLGIQGSAERTEATTFDLSALQAEDAPPMTTREKITAWSLGVSGSAAGVALAAGAAIVVINALVFALSPFLGLALFARMFGY